MTISFRKWTINDLPRLIQLANNPKIAANMMNVFPHPYTEESGKKFIHFATTDPSVHIFAIIVDGEPAGGIGLHPQHDVFCKNAELGYWLAEPYWNKGIATEAIKKMVEYGFANLDINRIYARPFGSNIPSQKALKKSGFKFEAKLEKTIFKNNKYEDEMIYSFRKGQIGF